VNARAARGPLSAGDAVEPALGMAHLWNSNWLRQRAKNVETAGDAGAAVPTAPPAPRLLCWIVTSANPKSTQLALAVQETWGRQCDTLLFVGLERPSPGLHHFVRLRPRSYPGYVAAADTFKYGSRCGILFSSILPVAGRTVRMIRSNAINSLCTIHILYYSCLSASVHGLCAGSD